VKINAGTIFRFNMVLSPFVQMLNLFRSNIIEIVECPENIGRNNRERSEPSDSAEKV
jgi:hypothetical protein